ncbi:MAG: hypothetical protein KF887_04480 [Paracoccaceae bacterium]|nr:MAG: hypothetical protein KF887_04480 [Paracoccaceae bacterium]
MAAAGTKKKIKFEIEIEPFDETDKGNKAWATGIKEIDKAVKTIKWKGEAELDDKKWPVKKLQEEGAFAARMALKIFAGCVREAKKTAEKGKEKDGIKAVLDGYKDLEKDLDSGLDKWLENIESGKADNAGALKAGKAAFDKLNSVEFKGAFDGPRKKAIDALKALTKDGVDPKVQQKAGKVLEGLADEFGKTGKEAQKAIDFLLKTGKKLKDDKDADAELKNFGVEVLKGKNEETFTDFVDAAEKLGEVFEVVVEDAKKGALDPDTAKTAVSELERLSGLEKTAQSAVALAKSLTAKFKKIEQKLK